MATTDNPGAMAAFALSDPVRAAMLIGRRDMSKNTFQADLLNHFERLLKDQIVGPELIDSLGALSALLRGPDADRFKLALVEDARILGAQRLTQGSPRALWGVTPLINLLPMASANRRLGMESDTLCYTAYNVTNAFSIPLKTQNDWVIANAPDFSAAYNWLVFAWALLRYDVFFFFNDRGLLSPGGYGSDRFGISLEEMQLLQAAGKRLYTMAYGADNRTRLRTLASGKFNFCMDCPEPGKFCICSDDEAVRMFSVIDQYATAMLASGLSVDYIPNAYELHYLIVDTDNIEPTAIDAASVGPLRLVHAPNHPFFKGSAYLEAAVARLQDEGLRIELELISGKTNTEVIAAMRRADVVADQFIGGAYGQTAIEAMAVGRPVLCYIKHPERVISPADLPILNCNPDTLDETLRRLASMPRHELAVLGEKSRAYVEAHHSTAAFSDRLARLYSETAAFPSTVRLMAPQSRTAGLARSNLNASPSALAARTLARQAQDAMMHRLFDSLHAARPEEAAAGARERFLLGPHLGNTTDAVHAVGAKLASEAAARDQALMASTLDAIHAAEAKLTAAAAARDQALMASTLDAIHAAEAKLAAEARERGEVAALQRAHQEALALQQERFASERNVLIETAHAAHAVTQEKLAAAEDLIKHIRSSTSWRITKPLRFAGRLAEWIKKPLTPSKKKIKDIGGFNPSAAKARGHKNLGGGASIATLPLRAASKVFRPIRSILDRIGGALWPKRKSQAFRETAAIYPPRDVPQEKWLQTFERLNGRRLRVLHIGNIANNAYNNAKIQRERGIDADVLCADYYHIMACPEWEDARFSGTIRDDMFPDWWSVKMRGYRRPKWFAQGPLDACVRYLLAYTAKSRSRHFLWRWLTFERWMLCRSSKTTDRIREFVFKRTARFIQHDAGPANGILWSWWGAGLQAWANREAARWPKTAARVRAAGRRLSMFGRTADIAHGLIRQLYRTQGQRAAAKARLIQLLGRTDDLPSVEWFFNWWYHPYMKLLMRRYDVVQCYATYTAMPFIIGHPYTAYEHGTIRTIPFQNTDEGKMCLATYRAAEGVFVTNTDNLVAADRMNIPRRQVTPLPHAFDSDKLVRFARKTKSRPPSSMVTFFTPTRQHWVDQDPGWAKGNDRVFHALKIVREAGKLCKVVAIAWGHDLEASKELAAKLGVADLVVWIPKLNKRQLWRKYLESHAVFDQFLCPALGGVTFEALMLGRRVITAIDEPVMTDFFGDLPPLYNCSTAEDIAAAMLRVIADPMDRAGDGDRNRRWMERRHSASTIVRLQVERYQKILATRTTAISKTRAETDKSGRTLVNS